MSGVGTFIAELASAAAVGVAGSLITIGTYREKVKRLEKYLEKLDTKVGEMKSELDKLLEFKTSTQKYVDSKIYTEHSPLNLTEFGKQLVNDSGFREIFEAEKDNLVKMLEDLQPATQYEVQEKAR